MNAMKTIKTMTPVIFLFSFLLCFTACDGDILDETDSTEQTDPDDNTDNGDNSNGDDGSTEDGDRQIIENQVYSETLLIDGHDYDGLIIRNCTFENITGDGLQIKNVDNLKVENCIFRNISMDGIRLRIGTSDNVVIDNNEIYNVQENGILQDKGHSNTVITNNKIYNVGLDSENSNAHHGIYLQGKNFVIEGNTIYDVKHVKGNAISVRSYGEISRNKIYDCKKNGITYYSDHPGYGGILLIENNIIYDNAVRGVQLYDNGDSANYIGKAIVRFNTIVSKDKSPVGMDESFSNVDLEVFGNILIRTDGGDMYIYGPSSFISTTKNLKAGGDIGFVNFEGRNLHLTSTSQARNFAAGLTEFPEKDFDNGTIRKQASLDAGACEIE
jgi:hypothetical protein